MPYLFGKRDTAHTPFARSQSPNPTISDTSSSQEFPGGHGPKAKGKSPHTEGDVCSDAWVLFI